MSFEETTRVPVVLREEDGALCAYFGTPDAANPPFLIMNTEVLNAVTPPSAALDKFRELASMAGAAMQKRLREELAVQALRESVPKGGAQ